MSTPAKNPRLTELPAELVTSKDACQILGIGLCNKRSRLQKLRYSIVAFKGRRCKVYRRDEVEALVDAPVLPGFTDLKTLHDETGLSISTLRIVLRRANVPRRRILRRHYFYAYDHAAATAALSKHKASLI